MISLVYYLSVYSVNDPSSETLGTSLSSSRLEPCRTLTSDSFMFHILPYLYCCFWYFFITALNYRLTMANVALSKCKVFIWRTYSLLIIGWRCRKRYIHLWPIKNRRDQKIEFEDACQVRVLLKRYTSVSYNELIIKLPANIYTLIKRITIDFSPIIRIC